MLMTDQPDDIVRPTRERMRRMIGHDEEVETLPGGTTRKSGAIREWSQLENLHRNNLISDEEYAAGRRYEIDHRMAGFDPRVTLDYRRMLGSLDHSSPDLDAAERREFHRKRWHQANKVLKECGTRKLIHWMIIENIAPQSIGRKHWGVRGKHTAAGRAVGAIQTSLYRLAVFYGLIR
jgi:hypothetical protein